MTWQILLDRTLNAAPLPPVNQAINNYGQVVVLASSSNAQPSWRSAGRYRMVTSLPGFGLPVSSVQFASGDVPLNRAIVLPAVSFQSWILRIEPHPWITSLQVRAWAAGPPIPPLNAYERAGKFSFWSDSVPWFLSNSGYWLNLCRDDVRTIGKPGSGADLAEDWLVAVYQTLWESPLVQVSGLKGSLAYSDWVAGKRLTLPDLRASVLMAGSSSLQMLSTVGANTQQVTLAIANLPTFTPQGTIASGGSHGHTLTVDAGGAHGHTLTVDAGGAHAHTISVSSGGAHSHVAQVTGGPSNTATGGSAPRLIYQDPGTVSTNTGGTHTHTASASTATAHTHTASASTATAHTHTASAASAGAHTHTFTGTAIGSSTPIDIDTRQLSTVLNLFVSCGGPL
jgi:hypothetical protein